MSRIFALVSVAIVSLAGVAAFGSAVDSSSETSEQFDGIVALFGTGFELTWVVPLLLIAGMFVATMGVLARA